MRLSENERKIIIETIEAIFGPCEIYLFGSRLDETKKGGDIDLFIVAQGKDLFKKKIKAAATLERLLLKPIDIVIHKDFDRMIEREALLGEKLTKESRCQQI